MITFLKFIGMNDKGENQKGNLAKGSAGRNARLLHSGFVPGDSDVICGRGSECVNHLGNSRFRVFVESQLESYTQAKSKIEKSAVIADTVNIIRRNSPYGGFVKKDLMSGQYYEVGDFVAVSIILALHFLFFNGSNVISYVSLCLK
jgi:hypothetical protein